jgi:hypothetical protein
MKRAAYMSTHAIKTELEALLREIRPEHVWHKRSRAKDFADFALAQFKADSADARERRAVEPATVVRPRLGS